MSFAGLERNFLRASNLRQQYALQTIADICLLRILKIDLFTLNIGKFTNNSRIKLPFSHKVFLLVHHKKV